jgi:hypothetical protein
LQAHVGGCDQAIGDHKGVGTHLSIRLGQGIEATAQLHQLAGAVGIPRLRTALQSTKQPEKAKGKKNSA